MIGAIFAQHAPLIRDYPGAPPTPPAPPAPPTPPEPPQAEPIAFSAVTRASLFGIIGSAISSTTLATITCTDAAMTIVQSEVVAGLTFSYTAGVLTIAGTATGSTRVQRVVVSYIASDGSNSVRGSTSHEITLVSASEVLTIGPMGNLAARAGVLASATVCSLSANYDVDVIAIPSSSVPGVVSSIGGAPWAGLPLNQGGVGVNGAFQVSLAWTRGATSTGTLTIRGVFPSPSLGYPYRELGEYTVPVTYYSKPGMVALGTSTHKVVVSSAYEIPAPAPAPVPAPSPPSPSPPPAPTPAPAPGLGPDATLTGVRVLMRFDTATGIAYDERGNTFTNNGATLTTGAVGQGAAFTGAATTISGTVASLDGISAGLSVECMADISDTSWAALSAPGDGQRFCPAVSYTAPDGTLLWALGYLSLSVSLDGGRNYYRRIGVMFWTAVDNELSLSSSSGGGAGFITNNPARFIHLAGCLKSYAPGSPYSWERAAWLDGRASLQRIQGLRAVSLTARPTGVLRVGGTCPAFRTYYTTDAPVAIVPFYGSVDELRIKTPGQYPSSMAGSTPDPITPARRVIPWPNY